MEVGLIGSYWGMRRFCYENGAFINAHDRAVSRDGKTKYRLLDKEEDLDEVPITGCAPGSVCFIIETSDVYMLNSNKEWKKI